MPTAPDCGSAALLPRKTTWVPNRCRAGTHLERCHHRYRPIYRPSGKAAKWDGCGSPSTVSRP